MAVMRSEERSGGGKACGVDSLDAYAGALLHEVEGAQRDTHAAARLARVTASSTT